MRKSWPKLIFIFVLIFGLFSVFIFHRQDIFAMMTSTGGYQIWADVVSVGGVEDSLSSSSGFQLRDTLGEPIIGRSSSTISQVRAGFREMERGSLTLSITPSSLDLGDLSTTTASNATATLSFYSDTGGSYVSFSGESLRNGSSYVQGIGAVATSSLAGISQFGFNAIFSQGDNFAYALSPYDQNGKYAFNSGSEVVKTDNVMSTGTDFTLNYIANISGSELSGNYSANLVFTGLGSF